jgi:hypothetical protein
MEIKCVYCEMKTEFLSTVTCMRDRVWIGNIFIDHLQVITTNNYNTIAVSTLYSSLEHTV